jgi:hypothetical protein
MCRSAPTILLVALFLFMVPIPERGQAKFEAERKTNKDSRAAAPPVAVEVRFTDDSLLKLSLLDKEIRLNTRYGPQYVPTSEIRYIDFATRIPAGVARRAEAAVTNLGSPQYAIRETAATELLELREKAYPALLRATAHKDPEVARRAEELLKQLREQVPADQLAVRPYDVVWTADSRIAGRIAAEAIKAYTFQFGDVHLKPGHMRSLQLTGEAPDPGNLDGLRGLIGKTFKYKVTGTVNGHVWGSGAYTTDSELATAAVHAGILRAGQTGVVRVTIIPPPGAFGGSVQNGVTSMPYGPHGGAYMISR